METKGFIIPHPDRPYEYLLGRPDLQFAVQPKSIFISYSWDDVKETGKADLTVSKTIYNFFSCQGIPTHINMQEGHQASIMSESLFRWTKSAVNQADLILVLCGPSFYEKSEDNVLKHTRTNKELTWKDITGVKTMPNWAEIEYELILRRLRDRPDPGVTPLILYPKSMWPCSQRKYAKRVTPQLLQQCLSKPLPTFQGTKSVQIQQQTLANLAALARSDPSSLIRSSSSFISTSRSFIRTSPSFVRTSPSSYLSSFLSGLRGLLRARPFRS